MHEQLLRDFSENRGKGRYLRSDTSLRCAQFNEVMKSCVDVACPSLLFPLPFLKAVDEAALSPPNIFVIIAWGALGASIVLGLIYQILAARSTPQVSGSP